MLIKEEPDEERTKCETGGSPYGQCCVEMPHVTGGVVMIKVFKKCTYKTAFIDKRELSINAYIIPCCYPITIFFRSTY